MRRRASSTIGMPSSRFTTFMRSGFRDMLAVYALLHRKMLLLTYPITRFTKLPNPRYARIASLRDHFPEQNAWKAEIHLFWKAMSMKQVADWALDTAKQRGAQYADARMVNDRARSLATKNGRIGHASSAETLGIGIRVLVDDSWGFASTDD